MFLNKSFFFHRTNGSTRLKTELVTVQGVPNKLSVSQHATRSWGPRIPSRQPGKRTCLCVAITSSSPCTYGPTHDRPDCRSVALYAANFPCKCSHRLYNVQGSGVKSSRANRATLELQHRDFGRKWKPCGVSLRSGAQPFLCVTDLALICREWRDRGEQENNAILIVCGWFLLLSHKMSVCVGRERSVFKRLSACM